MEEPHPSILGIAKNGIVSTIAVVRAMPLLFVLALFASIIIYVAKRKIGLNLGGPINLEVLVFSIFGSFCSVAISSVIAVVIHRFIIFSKSDASDWLTHGRIATFEFFVISFIISILFLLISIPVYLNGLNTFMFILFPSMYILALWLVVTVCRIFLIFPSVAVEAPGRSFASAKRAGKGLVLRFLAANALISAPLCIAAFLIVTADGGHETPSLIAIFVERLIGLFLTATLAATASHLFIWRQSRLNGTDPLRISAPAQ